MEQRRLEFVERRVILNYDIDLAMLVAALCGVLIGSLIAGVFLYVRGKLRESIDDDLRGAGPGRGKIGYQPICRYSTHDPVGGAIIRARRVKD